MVEKQMYYQIVETDTERVSSKWKVIHLMTLAVAAASGGIIAFNAGRIVDGFGSNCVLYAKIYFSTENDPIIVPRGKPQPLDNSTLLIDYNEKLNITGIVDNKINVTSMDLSNTQWGKDSLCNFCQFMSVVSMISSIIWLAFFLLTTKGGKGYLSDILPQPYKIVLPILIFSIIMTICLTASTILLMNGIYNFCLQFRPVLNNTLCVVEINVYTLQFSERGRYFYLNYALVKIFSYIGLTAWIIQILTSICRFLVAPDFQVYLITIKEKKEDVQKVIEYTDKETEVTSV